MLKRWVALATVFTLGGCAAVSADRKANQWFAGRAYEHGFTAPVFVSDKALPQLKIPSSVDADNINLGPAFPEWVNSEAPFHCSMYGIDTRRGDIPHVSWHLTGWQEYQSYNAVQHIHQNADPTQRLVLLTLSAAD